MDPDQAYYWTEGWQAGEAESLDAQARGAAVVFDGEDPGDVARWLLDEPATVAPPG